MSADHDHSHEIPHVHDDEEVKETNRKLEAEGNDVEMVKVEGGENGTAEAVEEEDAAKNQK